MRKVVSVFGCLLLALYGGKCEGNKCTPLLLTPLLEANEILKAQDSAKVNPSIGNTTSYSGYFTTNKTCGNNLFFWFFPSLRSWESAPVAIWLQGGPGVSSMYGLFKENGPLTYSNESGLERRKYSWNNRINMIYFDQPVGVGFSFSTKDCYPKNLIEVAEEFYSAVVQFFKLFPILKNNKLFIFGQSFAGEYIPAIAHEILIKNSFEQYKVNLSGLMIGSAWSIPREHLRFGNLFYHLGLIAFEDLQEFLDNEKKGVSEIDAKDYTKSIYTWSYLVRLFIKISGVDIYNIIPHPTIDHDYEIFLQLESTRRAIHVGSTNYSYYFGPAHDNLILTVMDSAQPWIEAVLPKVPMVFYTGQNDVICAYTQLEKAIRSFNWSGQHMYLGSTRKQWIVDDEVAGYIKGEYNLFSVLVRAAGHNVPIDQPLWAYQLINNFTTGTGVFSGKLSTMQLNT